MSLSVARPIVTEPAGLAAGADRGDSSLTNLVAKFAASPARTSSMVASVGGTWFSGGAGRALTTVVSSGGGPAGGGGFCTFVGYSDGDCGRRTGGAGRIGGGGRWPGGPTLRVSGPGRRTGGAVSTTTPVDCASRGEAVPGG